jgi:hypothetical protein
MALNVKFEGKEYNGWKNYETWNVALWIGNTENIYFGAVEFMKDVNPVKEPYKAFVISCGLSAQLTPDGIPYMNSRLDYDALDEMMKDFLE